MYDGKWRPEAGKILPAIPAGVPPVVRFKMPQDGITAWDDAVKGRIEFNNKEFENVAYFEPFYLKEFQGVKKKKAE